MPEDLPKAVLILLWLLSGVIVFGYLLMQNTVASALVFAAIYYAVPTLTYWIIYKRKQ